MFAYCENNPVNLKDPSRYIAILRLIMIGGSVAWGLGTAYSAYKQKQATGKVDWLYAISYGSSWGYTAMTLGLAAASVASMAATVPSSTSKGAGNPDWITNKGYKPQSGERTLDGYVKNNAAPEVALYTKSPGFNNNNKGVGGQFKWLGAEEHYGLSPHVHQAIRNVTPNGMIFGRTGKTVGVDTLSPSKKDIKQLYEYINNGKYHE